MIVVAVVLWIIIIVLRMKASRDQIARKFAEYITQQREREVREYTGRVRARQAIDPAFPDNPYYIPSDPALGGPPSHVAPGESGSFDLPMPGWPTPPDSSSLGKKGF